MALIFVLISFLLKTFIDSMDHPKDCSIEVSQHDLYDNLLENTLNISITRSRIPGVRYNNIYIYT